MHRFVLLLFILGLGQFIYAASISPFPDLTRRIPERPTSPGCAYKGVRYEHGDSVPTPEPCLNCTCIRAVLVCYLRVCPTSTAPPPGCFAAREVGECCPTLVCGGPDLSKPSNKSGADIDLRPTFQPPQEKTTDDHTLSNNYSTETISTIYDNSTDSFDFIKDDTSTTAEGNISTVDGSSILGEDSSISVNDEGTTIIDIVPENSAIADDDPSENAQDSEISPTDPSSTDIVSEFFSSSSDDDSLVYITSTREPTSEYDMNFYNDIPAGGCLVNGTLYGDGSAMLSSTFCEYCFCIRGKSTCLKPKCHLTIEGCSPRYDNHYTCCPTRYECTQKTSSVQSGETTTHSSTIPETTQYLGNVIDCFVGGTVYHQGDLIPDHKPCHNCYCNDSSVVCEKIKCSPPLEGCTPIIPQGYCCPISYRCDYDRGHLASNSIKGSNLNESTTIMDNKGTDIKSVKNYYANNNENVRAKSSTERESISILHNITPVQRRLDQTYQIEQNSTLKTVDNESVIQIGYGVETHKGTYKNVDPVRENDKTLKLELSTTPSALNLFNRKQVEEAIDSFYREDNSRDKISNIEPVTLGHSIVHTLSIQELFDQFFGRQKPNVVAETSLEPKRNNSKQPISIVEIHEFDDISESTTMKSSNTDAQTTEIDNKTSKEDLTLNTETEDFKTHSFTSSDSLLADKSDSFTEDTNTRITENFDTTSSKVKNENEIPSTITTENKNTEDFHTQGMKSTYPVLISTSDKNSAEDHSETDIYSEVKAFTAKESFDTEDSMDTSPSSQVFTSVDDLYNLKSSPPPQTHPELTTTDFRDIYNHETRQTQSTSSDYSTTKAALIKELTSQTQTRPVVLIYDLKNMQSKNPYIQKTTQSIPLLRDTDTTISAFSDKTKNYSDGQTTSLLDETTKIIIADDSDDQEDISEISSTVEDLYNVLKNHGEILSLSPIHITTRHPNSPIRTETPQPEIHIFETTRHMNEADEIRTSPSPKHFFTTTNHANNYDGTETAHPLKETSLKQNVNIDDQTRTRSPPLHTITINQYNNDKKQTLIPFTSTTKENFESTDHLLDIHTVSQPAYDTETFINDSNEDLSKETVLLNTFPSLESTKYQQDTNKKETTVNNIQNIETSSSTTASENGRFGKTESNSPIETNFPATRTEDEEYSVDSVTDLAGINTQKDTSATEASRISTRINSKLPSFNYVEKTDEKNNVSSLNYPVLTDSLINTHLPAESRDSSSGNNKNDFTNIGSVYLGAPLAVGGTDSRKEVNKEKPKITHSDGVIFLDPKFTDIDTKTDFESKKISQKNTTTTNIHEQASIRQTEKDSSNNEKKKGPRNQDQSKAGQGFKIIPFVAEDAVRGQFGKLNDTLVLQPGVTEGVPDIVSDFCFIKGRIYMNGEMIGKPDPCELCRCFYGRELCQIQRCPTPPPDCVPDKVPGFCCPRFTCGNNATSKDEMKLVGIVLPSESTSTTRKPDIIDRKPSANDKQEMKFGIRVRVRSSPTPFIRTSEYTTEMKTMLEKTTLKPEVRTIFSKPSTTKATTTTSKPVVTSKIPTTKRTTTTTAKTTTTTTPSPLFPDPWGLLKVSGCNIYGKFFNINDQVEILSGPCSHCICTTNGVECNDIC